MSAPLKHSLASPPRCRRFVLPALLLSVLLSPLKGEVDYIRSIKPLLRERCYTCHGALKQQSGLRLDTGAKIRQGGDNGPAVVAGKLANSN